MDVQEQARKLRLAKSAAASAVGNGCDPGEVRRVVEEGIAEAVALNARFDGRRPAERPEQNTPAAQSGALSEWARDVNAA